MSFICLPLQNNLKEENIAMKKYLKLLDKVWIATLAINLLTSGFAAAIYYFIGFEANVSGRNAVIFSYALMLLMVLCVFSAGKSTRRKIESLKTADLPQKAEKYRTAIMKRMMLYASVSLIAVVGLVVCAAPGYLLFCAISILLIVLSKPSETKVKIELGLTENEIKEFDKLKFETKS